MLPKKAFQGLSQDHTQVFCRIAPERWDSLAQQHDARQSVITDGTATFQACLNEKKTQIQVKR